MGTHQFTINGNPYSVTIKSISQDRAAVEVNEVPYEVEISGGGGTTPQAVPTAATPPPSPAPAAAPSTPAPSPAAGASGELRAPMPGLIIEVLVKVGDRVNAGDKVMRIEAMKMENDIFAPTAGTVKDVSVQDGKEVQEGQVLLVIG